MADTPNPDAPVGDNTDLDEVRAAFIDRRDFEAQVARRERPTDAESGAVFDAWLAEHDRQVAARALRSALPEWMWASDPDDIESGDAWREVAELIERQKEGR